MRAWGPVSVKFPLGQIVVTPKALEALTAAGLSTEDLLARHQSGDWGDCSPEERRINDEGIEQPLNLVSTYFTPQGERLQVVTKADRTSTFIHLAPRGTG